MNRNCFEGWQGQYQRMLRWRDRLKAVYGDPDAEAFYDFTYAFFQTAYHLRDWLVSTGASSRTEMQALFKSSEELRLCRDICNSSKHFKCDKPSIDVSPRIAREWDNLEKKPGGWYVYSDRRRPILELVQGCIDAWDKYLSSKGLSAK